MVYDLLEPWIVQWQERTTLELPHKHCHPQSTHADGQPYVEPVDHERAGRKRWQHQPEQLQEMHHQQPCGKAPQHLRAPFACT